MIIDIKRNHIKYKKKKHKMSSKLFYGESEETYDNDFYSVKIDRNSDRRKVLYQSGNKKIVYYPTKLTPGSNIYDAVTGCVFPSYFVGKDPLFKVSVLGEHLYYADPKDFENHFHTKVHSDVKLQWKCKNGQE